MRDAIAETAEIAGFGLVVAGVYLLAGLGVAFIVAGAGLVLAAAQVSR